MKNWIIVLLLFAIPMGLYGYMDAKAQSEAVCKVQPSLQVVNPIGKIVEFSSPMCSECKEIAPNLENAMKNYKESVILEKINVLEADKGSKYAKAAIKEFKITLVPTTVFINKEGKVVKKQQGLMTTEEIISAIESLK